MEFQPAYDPKRGTGRPLPKRGQIKAKIIGGLFRSVGTIVSKAGQKARKRRAGDGLSSLSTTPSPSCYYSSDEHSDA